MPVINGVYTKDFPNLGRTPADADLIPIAEVANQITYKTTIGAIFNAKISGTTGRLSKFTGSNTIGNSILNEIGNAIHLTNGGSSFASFGIINPGTPGDPGVDNDCYIGSTINNDFTIRVNNTEAARFDTALRLKIANIQNAITDTDKFLVGDDGVVKYRSGSEVLSDLGVTPGNYVTLDGTQTITGQKTFTADILANSVIFDPTPATIPTAQGSMYFDNANQTIAAVLNGSTMKIGEDLFFQIKNQSGSLIPKGTALRFDGVVGVSGRVKAVPFLADGTYPSTYFLGVAYEDIANGDDGKALWFGNVRGVNTNAYPDGTVLYASTTVAGGYQTTSPAAPNNIISVAAVVTQGASNGQLLVRPLIGSNINNDEGVKITSPTTGDLLQLQAGGLWENKTANNAGLVTLAGTQTITGEKSFTQDVSIRNGSGLYLNNTTNTNSTGLYTQGDGTNNIYIQIVQPKSGTIALTSDIHNPVTIGTANGLSLSGQVLSLGLASSINTGALSAADWITFNNKVSTSDLANYVTLASSQTITGNKTFSNNLIIDNTVNSNFILKQHNNNYIPANGESTIAPITTGFRFNVGLPSSYKTFKFETTNLTSGSLRTYELPDYSGRLGINDNTLNDGAVPRFVGSVYTTKSQINDNGTNVSIGYTTNPALYKLDVNGTARVTGIISLGSSDNAFIYESSGNLILQTGASPRLTVNPSGNLGLGVTPSAWGYLTALQVGSANISNRVDTGNSIFTSNAYFNGTNWIYQQSLSATQYQQVDSKHIWYTAPSGTAGNAISFTQAMTLDASGNLGVGISSVSARLHVNANNSLNEGVAASIIRQGGSAGNNGLLVDVTNAPNAYIADFRLSNSSVMRLDASGRLGIGTTSPASPLHVKGSGAYAGVRVDNTGTTGGGFFAAYQNGSQVGIIGPSGAVLGTTGSDLAIFSETGKNILFMPNGTGVEAMRITSGGNVLIGTTTDNGAKLQVQQGGVAWAKVINHTNAGTQFFIDFRYNGTGIGSILGNNTSTSYSTTSDYRLKQDLKEYNGLELISKIKTYDYEWKSDKSRSYGVLAHELQEVIPNAVTGEKDAERMQGVDYSKLVPILVKAIQELKLEIDTLKNN